MPRSHRSHQLNIRVTEEIYDVLDAAAFLGEQSPQELLAPMIEELVAKLANERDVQATVDARRARRDRAIEATT